VLGVTLDRPHVADEQKPPVDLRGQDERCARSQARNVDIP